MNYGPYPIDSQFPIGKAVNDRYSNTKYGLPIKDANCELEQKLA